MNRIYGQHACRSAFNRRADQIERVWIHEDQAQSFGPLMKFCASKRVQYKLCDEAELRRVTASQHNEGICLQIPPRAMDSVESYARKAGIKDCVLGLDGIANPHNIGAIMRTAAHFGLGGIISDTSKALHTGAAVRTAQGGYETIQIIDSDGTLDDLLNLQKEGYKLVATSSHRGDPLPQFKWPPRSLILLGSETDGMSRELEQLADFHVQIPGTGAVESLNAATAAGILLAAAAFAG